MGTPLGALQTVMSNEGWQAISQVIVALGIVLTALGGYGAYYFSKRIDRDKELRTAYTGELKAKEEILVSAKDRVWPKVEFGDSGAILMFTGPQGEPLIKFSEDTNLTIIREQGRVKVSVSIRDKTGRLVAELLKNEWKVNPQNAWDRNYTTDALEVRDPTGDVVLQARALTDRIQLQAKFYDSNGRGFAFGKVLGPQGWGGGLEFTGPANPNLRMKIEPMFKYPSDSHFGERVRAPGA